MEIRSNLQAKRVAMLREIAGPWNPHACSNPRKKCQLRGKCSDEMTSPWGTHYNWNIIIQIPYVQIARADHTIQQLCSLHSPVVYINCLLCTGIIFYRNSQWLSKFGHIFPLCYFNYKANFTLWSPSKIDIFRLNSGIHVLKKTKTVMKCVKVAGKT